MLRQHMREAIVGNLMHDLAISVSVTPTPCYVENSDKLTNEHEEAREVHPEHQGHCAEAKTRSFEANDLHVMSSPLF